MFKCSPSLVLGFLTIPMLSMLPCEMVESFLLTSEKVRLCPPIKAAELLHFRTDIEGGLFAILFLGMWNLLLSALSSGSYPSVSNSYGKSYYCSSRPDTSITGFLKSRPLTRSSIRYLSASLITFSNAPVAISTRFSSL